MSDQTPNQPSPEADARQAVFIRALFMILFIIIYYVAQWLVVAVAVFQFVVALITGKPNVNLTSFGEGLSRFIYQVARFLTFNTEEKPFPFSPWPGEAPAS
jgi:Domain of unknown function (DUF4389)